MPKNLAFIPIIPIQPVAGGYPEKALAVLECRKDGILRQAAVFGIDMPKAVGVAEIGGKRLWGDLCQHGRSIQAQHEKQETKRHKESVEFLSVEY